MTKFDCIEDRVIIISYYILRKNVTIREVANAFGISKSTVHRDLSYRLPIINKDLYKIVQPLLNENFNNKHRRGGEATKEKYLMNE